MQTAVVSRHASIRTRLENGLLRSWYGAVPPIWWLLPLSWIFRFVSALRRGLYRSGLIPVAHIAVPVVVVGNLTVGGSGKTPFVIWLSRVLAARGFRPGVLTRGYGGQLRKPVVIDGNADTTVAGDEAVLLARRCTGPVVAGADRAAGARLLLERFDVDVILSDDGLQHYALPRLIEIVTVDGQRGFGNGALLPAGPLREPVIRLNSVDLVVVKGAGNPWKTDNNVPVVRINLVLDEAVSMRTGKRQPLRTFSNLPVHAVAAIGRPESFFETLESAGLTIIRHAHSDHAILTAKDLDFRDGRPVLITEKDAVKVRPESDAIWCVPARLEFEPQGDALGITDFIVDRLRRTRSRETEHGQKSA